MGSANGAHLSDLPGAENAAYTADLFRYQRRLTRVVMVGDVGVGGPHPIRIQSMTTTRTQDVDATAAQAERLVRAGCEIVRITAPTPADAQAIGQVRRLLRGKGIAVPLVADIHFSPAAAMAAADHVEKVRVNPGNYADSRKFAVREYSDNDYDAELQRVEERFAPLVMKLKERGIALRIGTNHGSLSDRIMNRFGDTPEGMVESALEFVRICEKYGFHDIILSMKASNPKVMIAAYRLLAARMAGLGMAYPFHLGVTEAGNGVDARIKSAIGIGSLLEDGIGDTIRVSLAEEPEEEIPVAQAIAARYDNRVSLSRAALAGPAGLAWDPFHYARRPTHRVEIGGHALGDGETMAVVGRIPPFDQVSQPKPQPGARLSMIGDGGTAALRADIAVLDLDAPGQFDRLRQLAWKSSAAPAGSGPVTRPRTPLIARSRQPKLLGEAHALAEALYLQCDAPAHGQGARSAVLDLLAHCSPDGLGKPLWLEARIDDQAIQDGESAALHAAVNDLIDGATAAVTAPNWTNSPLAARLLLSLRCSDASARLHGYRLLAAHLADHELLRAVPLILVANDDVVDGDELTRLIPASISLGALLCDGIGDAVLVEDRHPAEGTMRADVTFAFNILQGSGTRLSRTDYVACPSCGRTLFDLQSTTERIKSRTGHLKGVKIAIMGCVVNGPGEMADADFGYVGGSPDHVNLYVGKECVERNVPAAVADERLIDLIKTHGRWVEPGSPVETDDNQPDDFS